MTEELNRIIQQTLHSVRMHVDNPVLSGYERLKRIKLKVDEALARYERDNAMLPNRPDRTNDVLEA